VGTNKHAHLKARKPVEYQEERGGKEGKWGRILSRNLDQNTPKIHIFLKNAAKSPQHWRSAPEPHWPPGTPPLGLCVITFAY